MTLLDHLSHLQTEAVNPRTTEIDLAPTRTVVEMLWTEDRTVADAVGLVLNEITQAVDLVVTAFQDGGRLIYVGAGTSGRLGVLDASEMPPTYGTAHEKVIGVIAGGPNAVFRSVEGAEDSQEAAVADLTPLNLTHHDVVCGITASGRTPYVWAAIAHAKACRCHTILVSTNPADIVRKNGPDVDVLICAVVGPEPITGSTRMKSGTAQKMILNMITTAAMVRIGKTYGNVMVDLQPTNEKLQERAKFIVMTLGKVDYNEAEQLLATAGGHVKTALVMATHACSRKEAEERLANVGGFVRQAMTNDELRMTNDELRMTNYE